MTQTIRTEAYHETIDISLSSNKTIFLSCRDNDSDVTCIELSQKEAKLLAKYLQNAVNMSKINETGI